MRSAQGCWGHGSGEGKSRVPQQLDGVARRMHVHQCDVFLKEKNIICDEHLTFVKIVRYPINTVRWLSVQVWRRKTPIFYTATDTMTDLVIIERVGNRQQDAMLPFYVGFWLPDAYYSWSLWEWRLVQLRPGDNLNVFCVFVGKATYNVEVKRRNFRVFCFAR